MLALWQKLRDMRARQEPITVKVLRVDKYGLMCNYMGLNAYVPQSQLIGAFDETSALMGQEIKVSRFYWNCLSHFVTEERAATLFVLFYT